MNILELADQSAEQIRQLLCDAGTDIQALVERCSLESERQGRKVLPRVSITLTIEHPRVAIALGYGVRAKRESVIELNDENQAELPGVERRSK